MAAFYIVEFYAKTYDNVETLLASEEGLVTKNVCFLTSQYRLCVPVRHDFTP